MQRGGGRAAAFCSLAPRDHCNELIIVRSFLLRIKRWRSIAPLRFGRIYGTRLTHDYLNEIYFRFVDGSKDDVGELVMSEHRAGRYIFLMRFAFMDVYTRMYIR